MKRWSWTLCAVLLAACTNDSPTEVGSGLLPPDAIRTYEIVLGPDRYLQFDTAFGLYSEPASADYTLLANTYQGSLNARALLRYLIPEAITVVDTAGLARIDSLPIFFEGRLAIQIDTVASTDPLVELNVYRSTELWHRSSANWQFRVDTGGVQIPWTQPGGSPGVAAGTEFWQGGDSVFVRVDSATIAVWADTTDPTSGAILAVATPNTRLRTSPPVLRLSARSAWNPDTVFLVNIAAGRTFIFEPAPADSVAMPRVGGTPSWRTVLRLKERLDTLTVPCPGVPGCTFRLGDVTINYAALQLQPVPPPPGFAPELAVDIAMHALLPSPLLPLQRSPLTNAIGFTTTPVPVSSFAAPGAPAVELPATEFLRIAFAPPDSTISFVPSHLALLQAGTIRTFGFGQFAELPGLRLIVTIGRELQVP
ncbi:MAG TPA: hypothetical protein VFZ69_00995 [Longimicrobiales bacterium]